MMFVKDDNRENCALYCSCGCNKGVVLKVGTDDWGYGLSLVSDTFYINQETGWTRFKKKCRRIWNIICNKEYTYFDICIESKDLKEFKEFVANM